MTLHHVLKMAAALHYRHSWTLCSMLSTICCRKSFSMLASTSWILSFKVSTVWGLNLYTLTSRQPQRKKSGDDKSGDWGATDCFKGLSCYEAKTHTVKTRATQRHLLRLQHITPAQFWHEQAMLPKQVPSAYDNFFKNYRQKQMGILYESSYTRGNNVGSVFEATWSKNTFFILTVYLLLLLTHSHNLFWISLTFLYQFLKNYNAKSFVLRFYHPSVW